MRSNIWFWLLFCSVNICFADSPLTSTDIHSAYNASEAVKYARSVKTVDARVIQALSNNSTPLGEIAAIVNALGWSVEGTERASSYLKAMVQSDITKLSPRQLFIYAYLKAMDDYFEVAEAEVLLQQAKSKLSTSYTVAIIHALSKAQLGELADCEVSELFYQIETQHTDPLRRDMNVDATEIIYAYMSFYSDSCQMEHEAEVLEELAQTDEYAWHELALIGSKDTLDTIHFRLRELPKSASPKLAEFFGVEIRDSKTGQTQIKRSSAQYLIGKFLFEHLLSPELEEFWFFRPLAYPRLGYREYIVNQLPSFVDYGEEIFGYANKRGEKDSLFSFLVYRLDRSPQNLKILFDRYKDIVFEFVGFDVYHTDSRLGFYTETLIKTYQNINAIPNYKQVLQNIGAQVAMHKPEYGGSQLHDAYQYYEPIISKDLKKQFISRDGYELKTDLVWFHSFWLRRMREGNAEVVFEILSEIDEYYKADYD